MHTMRANSPEAILLSLALHGAVAALMLFMAFVMAQRPQKPPEVFELVAGPPTDPGALVAPALGSPSGDVRLKVPPTRLPPEPKQTVRENVVKAPPKTKAEPLPKDAVTQTRTMTKEEYDRLHGKTKAAATPAPPTPTKAPRIDAKGIANGVRGGSADNTRGGGGGKALSRDQMDAMAEYFAALRLHLQEALERPTGASDRLTCEIRFFLAANGQIDNVAVARSSGDAEFDRSALAAFNRIAWPGPRPDRQSGYLSVTFRMKED
jgi:colicin import membrane protein